MPNDNYTTPPEIFGPLNDVFHFKYDIAAAPDNHLCAKYYTKEDDALSIRWPTDGTIYCNPPYSKEGGPLIEWIKKALRESMEGATSVLLLPADTSTKWFHDHVLGSGVPYKFSRRRIRFILKGVRQGSPKFGSLVVVATVSDYYRGLLAHVDI